MSDWNKWKHWLIFAVSIWTLLAFVFTVQRYGSILFSPETAVQLWNKTGDFILLRWLNSTIITGLLAIVAAFIGAYALLKNYRSERIDKQKSTLLSTSAWAHIIADDIIVKRKNPSELHLGHLGPYTASIAEFDREFGIDALKSSLDIIRWTELEDSNVLKKDAGIVAKALELLCIHYASSIDIIHNSKSKTLLLDPTQLEDFLSANSALLTRHHLRHLKKYFDWSVMDDWIAATYASTPPAASAAPPPKSETEQPRPRA